MYSVIASDGKTYGPVDVGTLKTWCAEGRVTQSTNIIDAVTGRTMRASDLQDLYDVFAPPPNMGPPPGQPGPTTGAFAPGQRPGAPYGAMGNPYGQSGPGGYPYQQPPGSPYSRAPMYGSQMVGQKSKVAAALLALFLGSLGVHRFYLGYTNTGIIMLLMGTVGWVFFALPVIAVGIWAFVNFVMILTGGLKDADGYDLS